MLFTGMDWIVSEKTLYESDGGGSVAVINLKKTKNGYQVESVVRPRDGAYRLMDLESMFGRDTKAIDQAMNVDLSPIFEEICEAK